MPEKSAIDLVRDGEMLLRDGDGAGAHLHYLAALGVDPDCVPALAALGKLLGDQGKLAAALAATGRALALDPGATPLRNNYANLLMRAHRHEEAREQISRCIAEAPDDPATWHNAALIAYRSSKLEDALAHIDTALGLMPSSTTMRSDRGHILMALGRLREGLAEYEYRWYNLIHLPPWDHHWPEWQGEDLGGKTLLLHSEQGFGDAIMLARLAPELAERGARVTLAVPRGLVRLLAIQEWPGVEVAAIEDFDVTDRSFDFHSPMFGALRWLGYEEPEQISSAPYLYCKCIDMPALERPVSIQMQYNVGICWASGRWNMDTALRRTIPVELFLLLAAIPGVRLWSLQKGDNEGDIAAADAEGLVADVTGRFQDWADTAAFVAQLDLVISVDTAVAHLAGAMGRGPWMLSPYTRCWRWWDAASGLMTPWYRGRIFSESEPSNWAPTMAKVAEALQQEIGLAAVRRAKAG